MKQILFIVFGLIAIFGIGVIAAFFLITSRPNKEDQLSAAIITINNHFWEIEVAKTMIEKARGLSYRESLGENKGMLFIFNKPSMESFWMKGMNFPLDIIWTREDKVVDITKNAPPLKDNLRPLYYSPKEPADMVLEIKAGQADEFGIKVGDVVEIKQ